MGKYYGNRSGQFCQKFSRTSEFLKFDENYYQSTPTKIRNNLPKMIIHSHKNPWSDGDPDEMKAYSQLFLKSLMSKSTKIHGGGE